MIQAGTIRIGSGRVCAVGGSLWKTPRAAEALASEGSKAEVIVLRALRPLDDATIVGFMCKTRQAALAKS